MGKTSGSLKSKRTSAPSFWNIPKKEKPYFVRTQPGPHPKDQSYPLLVLIRDVLKLTKTNRESRYVLNEGKVTVDGRIIRSPGFPVGLMDVIAIPSINKSFRLVPRKGGLVPVEIEQDEKDKKIYLVKSKTTDKGNKLLLGLHDGRVIPQANESKVSRGDSCIIKLGQKSIEASFKLSKGELALLVRGERSGEVATVEDLKAGTFSRERIATIRLQDGSTSEIPTDLLMPLGSELPPLTVTTREMS